MKRSFIVDVDLAGSTDLLGIADDIHNACLDQGIQSLGCKPFKGSTDITALGSQMVAPPTPKPPTLIPPFT